MFQLSQTSLIKVEMALNNKIEGRSSRECKERGLIRALPLLALMGMGLSGCSTYSSNFDCPYGTGMGCSSLSTVNKVVDANALDRESDLKGLGGLKNNTSTMIYFGSEAPSELITFTKSEAF